MRGRRDVMHSGALAVRVDFREVDRLLRALAEAGANYQRRHNILAQTLNRAGRRFTTQLRRSLVQWTGLKSQASLKKRMHPVIATSASLKAGVTVRGRHLRITKKNFGATWRRSMPGVRHRAWNRAQTAKGAFMALRGGGGHGGGIAFKRTSRSRLPIEPLWGPNPVREMERREAFVRAALTKEARWVTKEMRRRAEVELRKVKAKYGL